MPEQKQSVSLKDAKKELAATEAQAVEITQRIKELQRLRAILQTRRNRLQIVVEYLEGADEQETETAQRMLDKLGGDDSDVAGTDENG